MEQGIIWRLRVKFIAINMALAFLVLLITFGTVCALNHVNSVNTINAHLSYVLTRAASSLTNPADQVEGVQPLERPDVAKADIALIGGSSLALGGSVGEGPDDSMVPEAANGVDVDGADDAGGEAGDSAFGDADVAEGDADAAGVAESTAGGSAQSASSSNPAQNAASAQVPSAADAVAAPVIGSGQGSSTILTAVFQVERNGIYTTVPAYTSATIPDSILLRADETVLDSPDVRGYLPEFDLMYEKLSTDDGWLVAYANASSTHAWQPLAVLLAIVGLIALIAFFLINILFSQWATRPVALSIRQQQQFTADASHELKTPLTVILANLSILRSHADSTVAEQMQWVESSEREAQRMQLLVNDMLSLARPKTEEAKAAAPLVDPVDLTDLVEGEVLQFESVAFERGILLESRIAPGVHVGGDAEKLGRMVSTLIDNACKYVEDNGLVDVTLDVETSNAVADPKARLCVHNTGDAIPSEDLEHLFDRFFRADKARTGGKGGYGLGLAIGQQIANEHNGQITVASSAEAGTTFTVTLPLYDD